VQGARHARCRPSRPTANRKAVTQADLEAGVADAVDADADADADAALKALRLEVAASPHSAEVSAVRAPTTPAQLFAALRAHAPPAWLRASRAEEDDGHVARRRKRFSEEAQAEAHAEAHAAKKRKSAPPPPAPPPAPPAPRAVLVPRRRRSGGAATQQKALVVVPPPLLAPQQALAYTQPRRTTRAASTAAAAAAAAAAPEQLAFLCDFSDTAAWSYDASFDSFLASYCADDANTVAVVVRATAAAPAGNGDEQNNIFLMDVDAHDSGMALRAHGADEDAALVAALDAELFAPVARRIAADAREAAEAAPPPVALPAPVQPPLALPAPMQQQMQPQQQQEEAHIPEPAHTDACGAACGGDDADDCDSGASSGARSGAMVIEETSPEAPAFAADASSERIADFAADAAAAAPQTSAPCPLDAFDLDADMLRICDGAKADDGDADPMAEPAWMACAGEEEVRARADAQARAMVHSALLLNGLPDARHGGVAAPRRGAARGGVRC
jgi:hypothetical protein